MQRVLFSAALAAFALSAPTAMAQEWGDLKVRFVYDGEAPKPDAIDPNKDREFCGQHDLIDETLLVNPENKGIQNVIVYAYTSRRGGTPLPAVHEDLTAKQSYELANEDCRFDPHIVVMKQGDDLVVTNPDPVGHNANINTLVNQAMNFTVPAGGKKAVTMEMAEPAPVPVLCNIHPWMKAYVLVSDNPYAAVSDADGNLEIKNLPAGETLSFRVYHEAAGRMQDLEIGGEKINRRNVVEVEIQSGSNDLGEVAIPASIFN